MAYINRDAEVPALELWQADDDSLEPALVVRSNATDAPALRVRGAGDLLELRDADDQVVYSIDQAGTPSTGGGGGGGAVDSVNGKTGVVVLAKADVGLGSVDNTTDLLKPLSTATTTALAGKQALDSDLTAIAGLTHANDTILQTASGAWAARTPAQVKATLALAKGDVGLGNVDNTTDLLKPLSTATSTALAGKVGSADVDTIVTLTQAEYDLLTPDAATLYIVTD